MGNAALQAALLRDAGTFLADFGTTVTNGAHEAPGVLDVRDVPEEGAGGIVVMQRRTILRMTAGTGGTIADGTTLVIGGVTYRVEGDGVPVAPDGVHVEYVLTGAA